MTGAYSESTAGTGGDHDPLRWLQMGGNWATDTVADRIYPVTGAATVPLLFGLLLLTSAALSWIALRPRRRRHRDSRSTDRGNRR